MKLGRYIGEGCEKVVFAVKGRKDLVIAVILTDMDDMRDDAYELGQLESYRNDLAMLKKAGLRTPKTYSPRKVVLDGRKVWGLPMQRLKYHIWSDQTKFWTRINEKTAADAKEMLKALIKHKLVTVDLQFMIDKKGRLYAMDPGEVKRVDVLDTDDAYCAWCAADQLVGITMQWKLKKSKNRELRKLAASSEDGDYGKNRVVWSMLQQIANLIVSKTKKFGKWNFLLAPEPEERNDHGTAIQED